MEALHKLDLAIELLENRALFFCFFLLNLIGLDNRNYWLMIIEVPKFQAKVGISMVLREVFFEASAVVDFDSGTILLIDQVFCDIAKVL